MPTINEIERARQNAAKAGDTRAVELLSAAIERRQQANLPRDQVSNFQSPEGFADMIYGAAEYGLNALSRGTTGLAASAVGSIPGRFAAIDHLNNLPKAIEQEVTAVGGSDKARILDREAGSAQAEVQQRYSEPFIYEPRTDFGKDLVAKYGDVPTALALSIATYFGLKQAAPFVPGKDALFDGTKKTGSSTIDGNPKDNSDSLRSTSTTFNSDNTDPDKLAQIQQRQQLVKDGVPLTQGQATQDTGQVLRENELSKTIAGKPIRDLKAKQNEYVANTFDRIILGIATDTPDLKDVGYPIEGALRKRLKEEGARVAAAYKYAEEVGDKKEKIEFTDFINYLNKNVDSEELAPILKNVRRIILQPKELTKEALATENEDGLLIPKPASIHAAEKVRQFIVANSGVNDPSIHHGAMLKVALDLGFDEASGAAFKAARLLHREKKQRFSNNFLIRDLLDNIPGAASRKVPYEVMYKKIGNAANDELQGLKDTLLTLGEEGREAWDNYRAGTVKEIFDTAFSNNLTNESGKVIVSLAKLNKAIKKLRSSGKMNILYTEQEIKDIDKLQQQANVYFAQLKNADNYSGTASALKNNNRSFLVGMIQTMTQYAAGGGVKGALASKLIPLIERSASTARDKKLVEAALNPKVEPPKNIKPPEVDR